MNEHKKKEYFREEMNKSILIAFGSGFVGLFTFGGLSGLLISAAVGGGGWALKAYTTSC